MNEAIVISDGRHSASLNVAAMVALAGGLFAGVSSDRNVVLRREGDDMLLASPYRMGRRYRDPHVSDRGYPGSKLAKKARKGTLTHNGLR